MQTTGGFDNQFVVVARLCANRPGARPGHVISVQGVQAQACKLRRV
jgi:hypothetical protein